MNQGGPMASFCERFRQHEDYANELSAKMPRPIMPDSKMVHAPPQDDLCYAADPMHQQECQDIDSVETCRKKMHPDW